MPIIPSHELQPGPQAFGQQIYNGLCPILLTKGYTAYVDPEDFERINSYKWFANEHSGVVHYVRAARMFCRKIVYMQHEVLNTYPWYLTDKVIDHIDRNSLNNSKANLRFVFREDNMRNTAASLHKKGYTYNKRAKLWMVYLDNPGHKREYLGYVKTEAEAIARIEKEWACR